MTLWARADDGNTILAGEELRGQHVVCPGCEEDLFFRLGPIRDKKKVRDHWVHHVGPDCDAWYNPDNKMSDWHLGWQELVTRGKREVRIARGNVWHRADIQATDKQIIEVQHSPMDSGVIKEREDFYVNMVWLWDLVEEFREERLVLTQLDRELPAEYCRFEWRKKVRGSIARCKKQRFFDLGGDLVLQVGVVVVDHEGFHGWGRLVGKSQMVAWVNDGPPSRLIDPMAPIKERREKERRKRIDAERAELERQRLETEQRVREEASRAAAEAAERLRRRAEWEAADLAERARLGEERAVERQLLGKRMAAMGRKERQLGICARWLGDNWCNRTDGLVEYQVGPLCPEHQPGRVAS